MIARLWQTEHRSGTGNGVRRFCRHVLVSHVCCIGGMSWGAFFLSTGEVRSVLSLWADRASIDALESSPLYRETVARFQATGVLREPQTVELFEVTGGTVSALALAAELSRASNIAIDRTRS